MNSERKTDPADQNERMFQLEALPQLIWKASDGNERDVWSSSAEEFQAYVQQFGTVDNVDTSLWTVFDRLDYVNDLFAFCQKERYQFPFTIKPVERSDEASA